MKTKQFVFLCSVIIIAVIALSLVVINMSCKKEKNEETISGQVKDPKQNLFLQGVKIDLYAKKIVSGTVNYNFVYDRSAYTDSEGRFSFTLPSAYTTAYRIDFSKDNYFDISEELLMSDFANHQHSGSYELLPSAIISMHFKNTSPYDISDMITYRLTSGLTGCSDCCTTASHSFAGTVVDTVKTCRVLGNEDITIEWLVQKAGSSAPFVNSYFCNALDTTNVDIFY